MNKTLLTALIWISLMINAGTAMAEYITDNFEVMLRTGPSVQNKIISPLRSGTRIEVLREDAGNGHSQVQTSNGEIGYILSRFITSESSARSRLAALERQLSQLRSEPNELRTLLANSQDENRDLIQQNVDLTEELQGLKQELEDIQSISGNVIDLSDRNQRLETEVQQLLLQLDDIRIQNEALRDNRDNIRNLLGAGILLTGLFLGWILSISGRRNRNSWGS